MANTGRADIIPPRQEVAMQDTWASRPFKLFDGQAKAAEFARFSSVFPVRVVQRSDAPIACAKAGGELALTHYTFADRRHSVSEFLADTDTAGLLVGRPDRAVHEAYFAGLSESTRWPLWSVTKSVVSLLVGCAVKSHGLDIDRPVTDYVARLRGSGYDGVLLRHVLQMRSGVRWNENYADPASDIRRSQRSRLAGGSQDDLATTLPREHEPGTFHRYNTVDTEVVGQVLRAITGASLSALLEAWLWKPLGTEDDAYWVLDGQGVEWAGSGLMASLRDTMKVAMLVLQTGAGHGDARVSPAWIAQSTCAATPELAPGRLYPGSSVGYGLHWWVTRHGCLGIGICNQFVYLDRRADVAIVKFSANRRYASSPAYDETTYRHEEHVALFEAIAEAMI